MGCGQSDLTPPNTKEHKSKRQKHEIANPLSTRSGDAPALVGKGKYIVDSGAIVMEIAGAKGVPSSGILVVFSPLDFSGLVIAFRDNKTGALFARELTDSQLQREKDAAGITHGWAPFFKSIASDVTKGKAVVTVGQTNVYVKVTVISSKEPKASQPFQFRLDYKTPSGTKELFRYTLEPLTRMVQKKHLSISEKEKELRFAHVECERMVKEASLAQHRATLDRLTPSIRPLRENANALSKISADLQQRVAGVERRIRRIRQGKETAHPLDAMYEEGGARYFSHISHADEHVPKEPTPPQAVLTLIRHHLPLKEDQDLNVLVKPVTTPSLKPLLDGNAGRLAQQAMQVFKKLDDWDFNVFDLEKATSNNALITVTYALMYKLNLVQHFSIDDRVLQSFLIALQAGYHPNPYHNATHAADVTQVNYFIMMRCGLSQLCKLTQEDILASLLAGAIHDYDHPGFNNNFHTRTSAYLSTLYNDRSVLENHHMACIAEMLRLPKYNLFQPLSEEQQKDVRDTMVEMVLATDMGNHAKIFSNFRRRLPESAEWHERKEDVRLALSMSIKMADISNSGRPNHLYVEWAKNIAAEFYNQGDIEAKLKLSVSPFMDRQKEKTDFPKGQTSFMNFIAIPMLEVLTELLPEIDFSLQYCHENREYWQRQSGGIL